MPRQFLEFLGAMQTWFQPHDTLLDIDSNPCDSCKYQDNPEEQSQDNVGTIVRIVAWRHNHLEE